MDAPRNAATDWAREAVLLWSDRAWLEQEAATKLAPGFVRLDRRRVVSMPPADADEYIAQTLALSDLLGGGFKVSMLDVLAVRGERLFACRVRIEGGENEIEQITVEQLDEAVEKTELRIIFDADDEEAALAELDRLNENLSGQ